MRQWDGRTDSRRRQGATVVHCFKNGRNLSSSRSFVLTVSGVTRCLDATRQGRRVALAFVPAAQCTPFAEL